MTNEYIKVKCVSINSVIGTQPKVFIWPLREKVCPTLDERKWASVPQQNKFKIDIRKNFLAESFVKHGWDFGMPNPGAHPSHPCKC